MVFNKRRNRNLNGIKPKATLCFSDFQNFNVHKNCYYDRLKLNK